MSPADQELLRQVSRSFYLTLRALPKAIRGDLSLAYLLARASDTVADLATEESATRIAWLEAMRRGKPPAMTPPGLRTAEAELLHQLPRLSDAADANIHELWRTILDGQIFDLQRFADSTSLDRGELERYTYLVAGCVGEFWTRLCLKKLSGFSPAPADWMIERGIEFGKALQFVNLLRDQTEDAQRGRIYISAENLGFATQRLEECLAGGRAYLEALRPGRLKFACALPLRLARRTLVAVAQRGSGAKISRKTVYLEMIGSIGDALTPARFLRKPAG